MTPRYRVFFREPGLGIPLPPAPSGFHVQVVTSTSATLGWNASTGVGVTGYNIYDSIADTLLQHVDAVTSTTINGLTPNNLYQVKIAAVNSAGVGPLSSAISVQTLVSSTTTDMLMGSSIQFTNPGGYSQLDVIRLYRWSKVNAAVTQYGTKVVALSDDANISTTGGAASANALQNALQNIFNAHPTVEIHYANGNEIDRKSPNMTNYGNTMHLMRTVIDNFVAQGFKCSLWIDLTQNQIRNSPSVEDQLKAACADVVQGVACSMYPPGRMQTVTNPTFTPYSNYIDPVFALADDWGVNQVSCWETGIPVDPGDANHRPLYAAGMAQYIYDQGLTYGIDTPVSIWWDNWLGTASDPNNKFDADASGARTPDGALPPTGKKATAVSWMQWSDFAQYL